MNGSSEILSRIRMVGVDWQIRIMFGFDQPPDDKPEIEIESVEIIGYWLDDEYITFVQPIEIAPHSMPDDALGEVDELIAKHLTWIARDDEE